MQATGARTSDSTMTTTRPILTLTTCDGDDETTTAEETTTLHNCQTSGTYINLLRTSTDGWPGPPPGLEIWSHHDVHTNAQDSYAAGNSSGTHRRTSRMWHKREGREWGESGAEERGRGGQRGGEEGGTGVREVTSASGGCLLGVVGGGR